VGGLVVDQLAGVGRGPVLVPVDRQCPRASCTELLLLGAAQFLVLVVHIEIPGELLVVLDSVARLLALLAVPGIALNPAVDNVDGGAKTRADSICTILKITSDVKYFLFTHFLDTCSFGTHVPSMTCNMLGFGGWGVV